MNEDIILSMAHPYVKDGSITYRQFESIYDMLSLKEQYAVLEILYQKGINLVDDEERIDEDGYLLETDEDFGQSDEEEFHILYDAGLFRDGCDLGNSEENLVETQNIRQSNEILCALIQQGSRQALQDLCVKNKKLVDKYVIAYQKRYGNRLDFEDLEQVGFIGLMKAAGKFEVHQGNTFSTYAVWWIKQAISREIMDHGYAVRIPVHMMERIIRVAGVESRYIGLGMEERIEKISEELSISKELVRECLILRNNYLSYTSLNMPIGDAEEMELGEVIPEDAALSVENIIEGRELKHVLETVIDTLTEREQLVLRLRFGWDDEQTRTLEEIGSQFHVTRERIRQIEEKALRKLRYPSRAKRLKGYLEE